MKVVKNISQGDIIEKIVITGDTKALFEQKSKNIEEWNKILSEGK